MNIAYHYTIGTRADGIFASGEIRPATECVPSHELPVVWFSRNDKWEPTASKGITNGRTQRTATMREMALFGNGLFRFGVDAETLIPWRHLLAAAGIRSGTVRRLERAGRKSGALPSDWFGNIGAVPMTRVVRVEQFCDGLWLPIFGMYTFTPMKGAA